MDLVVIATRRRNGDVCDCAVVLEVFGKIHNLGVRGLEECDIEVLLRDIAHHHTSETDVCFYSLPSWRNTTLVELELQLRLLQGRCVGIHDALEQLRRLFDGQERLLRSLCFPPILA